MEDVKPRCLMIGSGKGDEVPWQAIFEYVTLDICNSRNPDIIGDATALPVEDQSFEAVFSSHLLEHLSPRRYSNVLKEWYRILKPGGEMLVLVPNLAKAAEEILNDPERTIYVGQAGPVTAIDMMVGIEMNSDAPMNHRWGFTRETLALRAKEMEWATGCVWEGRVPGPFDRCDLRLYGRKPGDHPWKGWDIKLLNTGDPYAIKLGGPNGRKQGEAWAG